MGVQFVLILKFGTERGRYLLMGVVWVPIILINVLKNHPAANIKLSSPDGILRQARRKGTSIHYFIVVQARQKSNGYFAVFTASAQK